AFKVIVGYSDHTLGITIPIAATAVGASIIEKHFTLDKTLEGPDHRASLEPSELTGMVNGIRDCEDALGSGVKEPTQIEAANSEASRKSLVAVKDLPAGTTISSLDMFTVKRPGTGIPPYLFNFIKGMKLSKSIKEDDVLTENHFKL
ncbi:MAG: N-acetylneuraminate synthase, partial [Gammaproteobacteria bacterium]